LPVKIFGRRRTAMAPRVVPLLRIIMSAIGAKPDMRHCLALVDDGATTPLCHSKIDLLWCTTRHSYSDVTAKMLGLDVPVYLQQLADN
jgi:hypothetical protein